MSLSVETIRDWAQPGTRCVASNKDCTKEANLVAHVGEQISLHLCLKCARELFTALGFIIVSQTGESIERLVGLKKRRSDRT